VKRKLGPLPVWAWALIAGGGIGAFMLYRKAHAASSPGEAVPTPELAGQALPLEGGGGGGGAPVGGAGATELLGAKDEAELLRQELAFATEHSTTVNQSGLGSGISEVKEAVEGLRELGLFPAGGGATPTPSSGGSAPGEGNAAVKAATGKGKSFPLSSSRGQYRATTYKGHAAHEYSHAVANGVGKLKNIIVLGGPAKAGHAVAGSHLPASVAEGNTHALPSSAATPNAAGTFGGWSRDPYVRAAQAERYFGTPIKWSRDASTRAKQTAARAKVYG
jgi:hypothetical protein